MRSFELIQTICMISFLLFLFTSCEKIFNNEKLETITVKGIVTNDVTEEPISNLTFYCYVSYRTGSGWFVETHKVSETKITTDENGLFTATIPYKIDVDNIFFFGKYDDEYTSIYPHNRFSYTDLKKESNHLILHARRYEKYKIVIKNTQPFDENDSISVYLGDRYKFAGYDLVDSIINYGSKPIYFSNSSLVTVTNWVGKNIHSEIHGQFQDGSVYLLYWIVKKNNRLSEVRTPEIIVRNDTLNYFELNY